MNYMPHFFIFVPRNQYLLHIDQGKILAQAAAIAKEYPDLGPSLLSLGYDNVGIDDGWQKCGAGVNHSFHNASGFPIWDTSKFPDPHAMVRKAKEHHGVGIGWYGNNCNCKESMFAHNWTGGHPAQDAAAAAALGFSGIKIDGCGPALNMTLWTEQLKANGRNKGMVIEDCLDKSFWWRNEVPSTPTPQLLRDCPSHFYRITRDIAPSFISAMFNINFMTNKLAPYLHDPALAPRPGCWSYPGTS